MREIFIESKDNAKIKYLRKICTNSNFAKKEQIFMIETKKLIDEVMFNENVEVVYNIYTDQSNFAENATNNILITNTVFNSITDIVNSENHICFVKFKFLEFGDSEPILVLDNIQDPGNVGTILRSANAFNFKNILALNSCSIYNPKVIRSAKGSLFDLNIKNLNLNEGIEYLKENEIFVIGTDLYGDEVQNLQNTPSKYALVLGNEGQGMSQELIDICQSNVKIETSNVESLNVAIAGSILMYEFTKLKIGE